MKTKILLTAMVLTIGILMFGGFSVSAATYGNLTYSVSDGEVTILECDKSASGQLVIPGTLGGYPVTAIDEYAFSNCTSLESIIIPGSVTSIGQYAFNFCTNLRSVTLSDNLTRIRSFTFNSCTNLTSIKIPNRVTSIEEYAFYFCRNLQSVTIPDSVASIGKGAFSYCYSLTDITFPSGIKSVADEMFYSCTNLTSITLPDSITSIGNSAFFYCCSLESITLPEGVITIGYRAFISCERLKSITIGGKVTSIGAEAFRECRSLTDVYYNGTKEDWNSVGVLSDNELLTNATIHCLKTIQGEYRINEIILKDFSGNSLQSIPKGIFLATVSFTNISSGADTLIILSQYTKDGKYSGLMYIQTEDVPTGSTIKLSVPVDNSKGDVTQLKAFCWDSFGSVMPMGNTVSFPAQ